MVPQLNILNTFDKFAYTETHWIALEMGEIYGMWILSQEILKKKKKNQQQFDLLTF